MDQSLLNSSLNLLDDSPRPQSSSSNRPIPCRQTTPQGSMHASNSPMHVPLPHASQFNIPPTPYVNQMAVNQHMGTQPALILPRISTGPTKLQPPAKTPSSQVPSNIQPSNCLLLMHCRHSLKIILSTIQLHHLRVKQGLKVQTGKVLSKLHQHPLLPLHQWKS